jgi:hypothetical protein
VPLYVLGRRMTVLYPYVPIGNSVRISIAIVSYLDTVSFGVTADYDAVPDMDVLVQGIRRGLAELVPQPAADAGAEAGAETAETAAQPAGT